MEKKKLGGLRLHIHPGQNSLAIATKGISLQRVQQAKKQVWDLDWFGNMSAISSQQKMKNSAWRLLSYVCYLESETESFRWNFKKSPALYNH